jgi:hypothetical protein
MVTVQLWMMSSVPRPLHWCTQPCTKSLLVDVVEGAAEEFRAFIVVFVEARRLQKVEGCVAPRIAEREMFSAEYIFL